MLRALLAIVLGFAAGSPPPRTSISGSVTSGSDPLPGVTMCLRDVAKHEERCAVSDAMGHFTFAAQRGQYDVSAELTGFDTVTKTVDVRDGQPVALALDLRVTEVIEKFTITCVLPNFMNGYVTDAENRPVAGAQVVLRGGDEPVSSTTDSRGYFGYLFTDGDRSEYELEVTSDGFKPAVIRGKLPPNGFRLDIKLEQHE